MKIKEKKLRAKTQREEEKKQRKKEESKKERERKKEKKKVSEFSVRWEIKIEQEKKKKCCGAYVWSDHEFHT